jgi:hypothetical protein
MMRGGTGLVAMGQAADRSALNGGIDEWRRAGIGKTAPAHFIAKDRNLCYPVPMDRYEEKGRAPAVICGDARRGKNFI